MAGTREVVAAYVGGSEQHVQTIQAEISDSIDIECLQCHVSRVRCVHLNYLEHCKRHVVVKQIDESFSNGNFAGLCNVEVEVIVSEHVDAVHVDSLVLHVNEIYPSVSVSAHPGDGFKSARMRVQ